MIAFNCQKSVLLVILCLCFLEFSLSKGTRGVRPRDSGLSRRVLKGNKEDSNEIKYAEISEDEDFTYIQFDDGSKDDKGDAAMVSSMDEEISSTNSTIDQQSVYHVKAKSPASKKKKAKKSRDTSKQKNSKLTRGSKILVKSHDEMAMPSTSVKEGSTTTLSSMDDIPEVDGVMDVGAGTILPDNASEDNATEDNAILPMDSRATLEPSSSPSTNGDQPTPLPSMFVTIIQSEANSQAQATNAPTIFPDNTSEDNVTLPTESPVTPEASSSPSVNEDQPTPLPSMFVTIIQSEADSQTQTTNAPTMETATIIAPTTAPIQATVPPTTGCPNRADIDGTFGYDFVFADREPTAEEVVSLENTTTLFFLDLFQDNFGDDTVVGVDGAVLSSQFGDQPPRQFTMNIAATVLFSGCAPSQEDMDLVIALSDGQLQDYLDRFVYLMEPIGGHIFMLVSRVEFSGSITTV